MAQRKKKLTGFSEFERSPVDEIEYEETEENLTASAGLSPILDLFLDHPLFPKLCACLPQRISNAAYTSETFALILIAGFLYGYDCLDDLEQFQNNPLIVERFGLVPTARAFGDWLRDFKPEQIELFKRFVKEHALFSRRQIEPDAPLIIDIDSTSHIQHGVQLEGLDYDYKGNWCLSSLLCSDELGFSYAMDLRSGSTFSSVGAPDMIQGIFSHMKHGEKKFVRADSAFCNEDCIEAAIGQGASFTITAHGNTHWEEHVPSITHWTSWQWNKEDLKRFHNREREPVLIELGSFVYQPGWTENLRFYIVVKRTWKYDKDLKQNRWYHYAVMTNWDLFKNSLQSVMTFHQKRGHAENVIREHKYAFDLKHFPCKKMSANQVYALFAVIAHNHLRTIALLNNREKPLYAKRLRFKLIYHPGKIIRHARRQILKFSKQLKEEVALMLTGWARTREFALARGG